MEKHLGDIDPAEWGLEFIGEFDVAESFEYYVIGVWRGIQSRKLYVAKDSGCSCGYPWDCTTKEDLEEVSLGVLLEKLVAFAEMEGGSYRRQDHLASAIELWQRVHRG